jgi:hypothetical protein
MMAGGLDTGNLHDRHIVRALQNRRMRPEELQAVLTDMHARSGGLLEIRTAGHSFEGRPIRLVKAGSGETGVLLWSQMHGDEPTATLALCDILNFLLATREEPFSRAILSSLTVYALPMLNPDGAFRFQRRTAQSIDLNRDAVSLVTPEARLLKKLQQELLPAFGFNLHDQELSTVGPTREITALGLLAPSPDAERSPRSTLSRAKQVGAVFAAAAGELAPGRLARYDDAFESRAFGDNMQKWGVSTLLVESGHTAQDPEKQSIRRLNFTGILSCLHAIATGEYAHADPAPYETLPMNTKRAYEVIIRNVTITYPDGSSMLSDLGISSQVDTHPEPPAKLVDLGDLRNFAGLTEIDARGRSIPSAALVLGAPFSWERYRTASGSPSPGTKQE